MSYSNLYWAIFDFAFSFLNIGIAIKRRDSYWALLNWVTAGCFIPIGLLQIMGKLPLS